MSDPLDLDEIESYLAHVPALDNAPITAGECADLVAEVRRLRAERNELLTEWMDPLCRAEGCQVKRNDGFDPDLGIWRGDTDE